jgi:hypothetical protein
VSHVLAILSSLLLFLSHFSISFSSCIIISPLSFFSTGKEILHYDVTVFPTEECELNGYSFTSLPEAIAFYTDNRLNDHYLTPPERPVVAEIVHRGTTPKTIATQPVPPPRSTPLQAPEQQSPCADRMRLPSSSSLPSSASLEETSGMWGPASSGDTSANSYSLPTTSHITNESPNNSQDVPSSVPDTTTSVTGAEKKAPENATTAESSSNNPFDDVISFSTFHPAPSSRGEPAKVENTSLSVLQSPEAPLAAPVDQSPLVGTSDVEYQQIQPNCSEQRETGQGRGPPPVPVRGSSVLQMTPEPLQGEREEKSPSELRTEEISTAVSGGGSLGNEDLSEARRKLKRIPSVQERKRRLEAQMNAAGTPQSQSAGEKPGRVVISEALGGVSAGMPGSQHPLVLKKQEEAAGRKREEREREEQERLEREKKEKEERERITRRFPIKRSVKGKREEKGKKEAKEKENRRSMTESERDELQNAFQRVNKSRPTSSEQTSPHRPLAVVGEGQLELHRPAKTEEKEPRKEEVDEGKVDKEVAQPAVSNAVSNADPAPQPPPPSLQPPPPPPPRSGGSSRSSTLDRTTKPPPSSSPPSLPGSIDRRTWHGSKPSTLERTSRSGSRPGTLERKNPPPAPTSHPPPVPEDVRKEQQQQTRCKRLPSVAGHGFSGGRLELADLIPGVSRRALTEQTPSSSSTSPPRRYTITNGQAGTSSGPINAKRSVKERRSTSRRGHF